MEQGSAQNSTNQTALPALAPACQQLPPACRPCPHDLLWPPPNARYTLQSPAPQPASSTPLDTCLFPPTGCSNPLKHIHHSPPTPASYRLRTSQPETALHVHTWADHTFPVSVHKCPLSWNVSDALRQNCFGPFYCWWDSKRSHKLGVLWTDRGWLKPTKLEVAGLCGRAAQCICFHGRGPKMWVLAFLPMLLFKTPKDLILKYLPISHSTPTQLPHNPATANWNRSYCSEEYSQLLRMVPDAKWMMDRYWESRWVCFK